MEKKNRKTKSKLKEMKQFCLDSAFLYPSCKLIISVFKHTRFEAYSNSDKISVGLRVKYNPFCPIRVVEEGGIWPAFSADPT